MNNQRWISLLVLGALGAGCGSDGGGALPGDVVVVVAGDVLGGNGGGDAGADATADGASDGAADGEDGGAPGMGIDAAEAAGVVGTAALDRPVGAAVSAGPWVFLLYEDKDFGALDLADPTAPVVRGPVATTARALAVAWDDGNRIAYVADASGTVQAIGPDALAPGGGGPLVLGSLTEPSLASKPLQLARVGDRLYALTGATLLPLDVTRSPGSVTLAAGSPIALPGPATHLAAGGGALYTGDAAGNIASWRPAEDGTLTRTHDFALGGSLNGLAARGGRVVASSSGVGLKIVDFGQGAPVLTFASAEVDDVTGLALSGRAVALTLARGAVSTLDVSDFASPRVLTTNAGALPPWVALTGGTLVLGGATAADVAAIPPFVSGRLPAPTQASLPRQRLVPVTVSKPLDAASVTAQTVRLTCDGALVTGSALQVPGRTTVRFRPADLLPAGAACSLDLTGAKDDLGLPLATADEAFTTATEGEDSPIVTPASASPHVADGGFTGWAPGEAAHEWSDVTPFRGVYSHVYADFDGESLWLLSDWLYGDDAPEPNCASQVTVTTGGGADRWDVRVYGDGRLDVLRNGAPVSPEAVGVAGGASFGPSPTLATWHTLVELRLPATPGAFSVQLHGPGPSFPCNALEQEPTPLDGQLIADEAGASLTIATPVLGDPPPFTLSAPADGVTVIPPFTLEWAVPAGAPGLTTAQVQVSTSADFAGPGVALDVLTQGTSLTVADGTLPGEGPWFWRVVAWSTTGSAASEVWTFTQGVNPSKLIALPDQAMVAADTPAYIPVLENDQGVGLKVTGVTQGEGGATSIGPALGVTYAPGPGFVGLDSFTYTVTDQMGATAVGTVGVLVQEPPPSGFVLAEESLTTCCTSTEIGTLDINADGRIDVVALAPGSQTFSLFVNEGEGGQVGFAAPVTLSSHAKAVMAIGDLSGDGHPDVVGSYGDFLAIFVPYALDPLSFVGAQKIIHGGSATSIAIGDLDGDGLQDVVVNWKPLAAVPVALNRTTNPFDIEFTKPVQVPACMGSQVVATVPSGAAGFDDVVVACPETLGVLRNLRQAGVAAFAELHPIGTGGDVAQLLAADLNGDGRSDLVVVRPATYTVDVIFNLSTDDTLAFAPPIVLPFVAPPLEVAVLELSGGGLPDLAVALLQSEAVSIVVNATPPGSSSGVFQPGGQLPVPGPIVGLSAADVDGDGDQDLVVGHPKSISFLLAP